ncbi:hypothetical protein HJG60_011430 [Phyllostomus discolor]|uniref:Uncharacterized protein n=1 Tax=Phyllostomus discolor TaxID=89673 RepID=A0A834E5L5_9CHIR|nr:hypothetical protein HJG60_011430 [Phyllostomus discolor]
MPLNQQSCVTFSIFARTLSPKGSHSFGSGYNLQCTSLSAHTHMHTHTPPRVLQPRAPELEPELRTVPCSQPSAGPSLYRRDRPLLEPVEQQGTHFRALPIFPPRETSSQDTQGSLRRLPASPENTQPVAWLCSPTR